MKEINKEIILLVLIVLLSIIAYFVFNEWKQQCWLWNIDICTKYDQMLELEKRHIVINEYTKNQCNNLDRNKLASMYMSWREEVLSLTTLCNELVLIELNFDKLNKSLWLSWRLTKF
jgi:hypothetical protein